MDKLQDVQQKLEAFLAQEKEQKERAQRCFVSYLRSVYLMKNKEVFDVFKLQIQEYAVSLGLALAPRVRFLNKAQAQRAESHSQREDEQSEDDEALRSFKAHLRGHSARRSESEGSSDDDQFKTPLQCDSEKDNEDDLMDLDLLTVKRRDVFNLTRDSENAEELAKDSSKKTTKETKFKEAKRVLKRNFRVNTKVSFNEEGEAVQLWPPVQRLMAGENEEEEEELSGISVEKNREKLKREDVFDKQEYRRKIQEKHREQRLKAKAARREAKGRTQHSSDEEDEVLAYLANHSEDEFDPSTLPDPDKLSSEEEEKHMGSAKRKQVSLEEGEDDELPVAKRKMSTARPALDTGLSLAEDEELVLHLLGGQS